MLGLICISWWLAVLSMFSSTLLSTCMLSFENMSVQVFCLFFNQIVYFFFFDVELCELFKYNFILTSYWSYHLQIFSHSVEYLSILSMVSFAAPKLLSLIRSHLFIFVFNSFALGDTSDKGLLWFTLKSVLPVFSSRSFMVSGI